MGDEGDHRHCPHHIADGERDAEAHLQRQSQDHRLDGEEDEGEGGVDQRGDRGAEIAEARPAGEQVDIHPETGGVIADGQAGGEDDGADRQDGRHRIGESIAERHRPADGLQRQEGDGAKRRVRHPECGPAPGALRGEAQREVFQCLVTHPLIVLASDADNPLFRPHGFRSHRRLVRKDLLLHRSRQSLFGLPPLWFRRPARGCAVAASCRSPPAVARVKPGAGFVRRGSVVLRRGFVTSRRAAQSRRASRAKINGPVAGHIRQLTYC